MVNNPNIRFKGFSDEWEVRKLKDVVEKQIKGKAQFEKLEQGDVEYLDTSRLNGGQAILTNGIKDVTLDDILILWDGSNAGTVYHGFEGALGSTLKAYRTSADSKFVYQYLKRCQDNIYNNYRTPNIPHVQKDFLDVFTISVPGSDEQQKIGSLFSTLDHKIGLEERQISLLKDLKKGYLEKMLPKEGAKVPEWRFAGFADDWEERKLGEVIDIENGYAFKSEYFSDEEKRHIVLTPGSVKIGGGFQKDKGRYYDVSGVFPEKFIFKSGDIFITMTDLTPTAQSLGYPAIVPRDDNVYLHNQRLGKIINTAINPEFLYTLLTTDTYHKEIVSSASGTTVKHSSVSKILDFKSAIPNIDEQKLIGAFFKHLDNTITLQQRKLNLLKELKKGLSQQMFV